MNHFEIKHGALHAEDVAIADIAAAVGTPVYCYSTATLERPYRVFAAAFADVPAAVCSPRRAWPSRCSRSSRVVRSAPRSM